MARRRTPLILLLVAVVVSSTAALAAHGADTSLALTSDLEGAGHGAPEAVASVVEHPAVTPARTQRVHELGLAVAILVALEALTSRRRRLRRDTQPWPRPALLRVLASRGPPLLPVASI